MKELVLGESLAALMDYRGKTPKKLGSEFVSAGIPVASAILVSGGQLDLSSARFVSEETWRTWMSTPTRRGDVLLTSEAPLGRVARITSDEPLVLGQRLFGLRGREGVLDNGFLYYALQSDRVQSDLVGRSTGTTVFGIRQSALRKVLIPAPPFEEQRAIAEVLGALDDKIAANVRLVVTAERLMVALASCASALVPLLELASQSKFQLRPESFDAGVAHFSLPAFDMAQRPERVAGASIKSNKFVLDSPCVLVSKLNPRFPRVWNVSTLPEEMPLASTEFVVLRPLDIDVSELWSVLAQPAVATTLQGKVAGTSGSHQRVKPAEVLGLEVRDPRSLSGSARNALVQLGRLVHARREESESLAETRDALLPSLMSGKIRVKDAERVVGEAV